MGLLDIVVVAYKCYEELELCIESIEKSDDEEAINSVVVVDNSPSRGYWANWKKGRWPNRVIQNKYNVGFGTASNQGMKVGRAPYVALLNPDCMVERSAFRKAVSYLEQNRKVAVLGPKILEADGSTQGSARAFPNFSTAFFGRSSFLTKLFPKSRFVKRNMPCFSMSDRSSALRVDWVSGAAMFLRRKAVEEVGMFDERFFMYWEDADLCRRIAEGGWHVVYYPIPKVVHKVGRSSRHHPWKKELYFHKSALLLATQQDRSIAPWRTILVAIVLNIHMALRIGTSFLKMN